MEILTTGEVAKALGKTKQTIRNWDKSGYLKPIKVGLGGNRYYTQGQVDQLLRKKNNTPRIIIYCRASTAEQVQTQVYFLRRYCIAKGYQFEIITDIGSDREGLNKLLDEVLDNKVDRVVLLHRIVELDDIYSRRMFNSFNTEIEIVEGS